MRRRSIYTILAFVAATFLVACSDDPPPPKDTGPTADVADSAPPDLLPDIKPDAASYCPSLNLSSGALPSPLQGVEEAGGKVCAYYGVPYAEAPTGQLRWKRAQKKAPWDKTLIADKPGTACLTTPPDPTWLGPQGEDCLNLNIWAPKETPKTPAPVLVWLGRGRTYSYGGLYGAWDHGREPAAREGLVVVSINWRKGPIGFLAHPDLDADSGNYGLIDQQVALQWIQDNIKTFGGDPKRVTIYGGGPMGASSACTHLVLDSSKGLFHGAIIEGGFCPEVFSWQSYFMSKSTAETVGKGLTTALGCDTKADVIGCLRTKSPKELHEAMLHCGWSDTPSATLAYWSPVVDGALLKGYPGALLKAGTIANKVPVLIGGARDDGLLFVQWTIPGVLQITKQAWVNAVTKSNPTDAAKIIAMYDPAKISLPKGTKYSAAAYAMKDTYGDSALHCPQRRAAGWLNAAGVPVYRYHQSLPTSGCTTILKDFPCPPDPYEPFLGTLYMTFHVYALHNPQKPALFGWLWDFNAQEKALSEAAMGYWARFAATGDPNGGGAPTWPKYDATKDEVLDFGAKPTVVTGLLKTQCDMWDSFL